MTSSHPGTRPCTKIISTGMGRREHCYPHLQLPRQTSSHARKPPPEIFQALQFHVYF